MEMRIVEVRFARRTVALCVGYVVIIFAALLSAQAMSQIVLGRITALSGPAGAKGTEQEAALVAYFDDVNKRGGINGRQVVLKTVDEGDAKKVGEIARRLNEVDRVFAYFMIGGTPGSEIVINYATPLGIPVIAPNSGANAFHEPVNSLVFNVRAKYQDEIVAGIRHFATLAQQNIAIVHVDDAFGRDALAGFTRGLKTFDSKAVFIGSFNSGKADAARHVPALLAANPDAVICVGASKIVADLIRTARRAGSRTTFMTLSNNSSSGFVKELGEYARGVIVSQVTPPPKVLTTKLSIELNQLLAKRKDSQLSYAAMDAYASAKVLVQGLRGAGRNLTRESFVRALEAMSKYDLGGMEVGYGLNDRTGSTYVELSMIGRDGNFVR